MNDPLPPANTTPPPLPAAANPPAPASDPAERDPIAGPFAAVEAILRQPRRLMNQLRQPGAEKLVAAMVLMALLGGVIYGVVVGTFSGGVQLWAAPVKIAAGMVLSAIICLPSLYIFVCLSGSRACFGQVAGLVAGLLLLTAALLVGFAPVAWLFSQSTSSAAWMGALHLMFWIIATAFGLRFLHGGFAEFEARTDAGFKTWVVIFMLVTIQMTTALRPLVGTSKTFLPTEKKFFLQHWGDCMNGSGDK